MNFTKVIFRSEVCFPTRPRLFRMTSYEFIWHCVKDFGVVFSIHQAVRFTRSCRIYLQLQDLGQDKPTSLLLKPFSLNKRLFHLEQHFQFSNFADVSGTRLHVIVTSKNNLTEADITQGYTGRLPLSHFLLF